MLAVVELVVVDEVAGTVLVVGGAGTVVSTTFAEHAATKRLQAARAARLGKRWCTGEEGTTVGPRCGGSGGHLVELGRLAEIGPMGNSGTITRIYNPAIFNCRSWEIQ